MTDIAKLKQEAEDARKAAIKEIRYTHTSDFYDPSAIADSLIAATIAQIALQAAEKEAEAQQASENARAKHLDDTWSEIDRMKDEAEARAKKLFHAPIADDTWIKWEGDGFPVANRLTRVQAIWRSGYLTGDDMAFNFDWRHNGGKADIIAYRIISPAADRVGES